MTFENIEDAFGLTSVQEGMLLHTVAQPNSGLYVQQLCHSLSGDLDEQILQQAWQTVTEKFSALRTVYLWDGLDEPLQVIHKQVETKWTQIDWTALPAQQQQKELKKLLAEDRHIGFDLASAPIGRHWIIKRNASQWYWVWSCHHIQLDGWSTSIVLKEFFALCNDQTETTAIPTDNKLNFHEYVDWRRTRDLDEAEAFWKTQLSGFAESTQLNTSAHEAELCERQFEQTVLKLNSVDSDNARRFAREHRITLNVLLQGVWSLLLSRYARQDDIVYGCTLGGRPPELDGIEHAVGLFINTLPVRIKVSPDVSLTEWLAGIQQQLMNLQQWEFCSLAKVQGWSDLEPGDSLFQNIFVFENYPGASTNQQPTGFEITDIQHFEHSNYPFALLVVPNAELELIIVHDTARHGKNATQQILQQLTFLLNSFLSSPARRLGEFSLAPSNQQWRQDHDSKNATSEQQITQLFDYSAARSPDHPAIVFGAQQLTYAQLTQQAKTVSHQLQELGIRPSDRVGIHMNRSFEMIVAILGVLKAGAAYVPLDPDYPQAHLDFIAADSELSIVLTKSDTPVRLSDASIQTINLDSSLACVANKNTTTERPAEVTATDLAYVIYTSGSSGKAKGVPISHANIVSSTKAREEYYGKKSDRFLLLSSFAFDSSCASIFGALCTGGTLVLPEPGAERDMAKIERLIESQRISSLLCLPSLYSLILEHSETERLGSLQTVITAGEKFPAVLCRSHFEKLPAVRLFNEYGPTEATVWSTVYEVKPEDTSQTIPIGKPIANVEIMIADSHGQPAPLGVPGELLIGGPGITSGYLNQPQLTAASFVHQVDSTGKSLRMYKTGDLVVDPGDGNLLFLGRKDDQVKIRGYRIEPSAIEQTLCSHPAVREAVVVPISNETNNSLLQQMQALPPEQADRLLSEVEGMLPHADPVTREPSL